MAAKTMKRCTKCKASKKLTEFGRDRSRGDGLAATCVSCRRVKVRLCTKGRPSQFKGKTHTDAAKAIMSAKRKGHQPRLGIRHTLESRRKMGETKRARGHLVGPKHPQWKIDRSGISDRCTREYKLWRMAVYERDKFTCQKCGDARGGNLYAHHIMSFAKFPKLRFEISNGLTLCHLCHELEHFTPDSIRNRRKLKRGERLYIDRLKAKMECA